MNSMQLSPSFGVHLRRRMALATLVAFAVALIDQNWIAAAILGGALVYYVLNQSLQILIAEVMVNRSQIRQGKPPIEMTGWRMPLAVIMALTIYPIGVWMACRTQSVTWRAVTYQFNGPFKVRRLNYQPFELVDTDSTVSL